MSGDHRRLIDEAVATEAGPITFCLYWHEFHDRRIRSAYERAGRVICHGYRGLLTDAPAGTSLAARAWAAVDGRGVERVAGALIDATG